MTGPPDAAVPAAPGRVEADVAIIGAGVAGLYASINLPEGLDVVVIDKGAAASGSSPLAQGGMAAALGPDDSPELHAEDTARAGAGLVDPAAALVHAAETPEHTQRLIDLGAEFDRNPDGSIHLAREGGQAVARSVHRADATGAELVRVLRLAATPRVRRLQGNALDIATTATGEACGVWVLSDGELVLVRARAVLLATGGCGGLYAATTNRDHATGDGVALAYDAGAAVRGMEFVQFHPTGLAIEGSWRLLLTEALRGAGATLHNAAGERFVHEFHPDAELAPRHVVARAILEQDGGAWLDATHLGIEALEHEFPTVLEGARRYGFDLATERVPVTPAAHYMVGGVRTDLYARTSVPGLYAAGEVASTGLHGGNRMAGNSLSEALVFGARAAVTIVRDLPASPGLPAVEPELATATPGDVRQRMREAMLAGAGPVRSAASLRMACDTLRTLREELGPRSTDTESVELHAAITTAELICRSALLRDETRGGHFRTDCPDPEARWAGVHLEQVRPG